jgi:hypothetical protein
MENTIEQWKPVVGFEGFYEVSTFGWARSIERICRTALGTRKVPAKIMSIKQLDNGYSEVTTDATIRK